MKKTILAFGASLVAVSVSQAATYSVAVGATDLTDENDILATATTGVNFGGAALDVTHSGGTTSFADGSGFMTANTYQLSSVWGGTEAADADFQTFMDNQAWHSPNNSDAIPVDVTVAENTVYQIQFFYSDQRPCCPNRTMDIEAGSDDGSGPMIVLDGDSTNGQYGVFEFTTGAGETTATFYLNADNTGTVAHMNGYALANLGAVPEPSSTALLGLGGLALILRRRK